MRFSAFLIARNLNFQRVETMKKNNHVLSDSNISGLLFRQSLPAIIGMFVQGTYNFVDGAFVGRGIGELGIAGVTVVLPISIFILAVGSMLGIGGASLISRSIGAGDFKKAENTVGTVFLFVLLFGAVFTTMGLIFLEPMLRLFGADNELLPYAAEYGRVIIAGSGFFAFAVSSNNLIRSEGHAKVAMGTMFVSAFVNIILDAVFIFVFKWGMMGVALATVIAQTSMAIYTFCFLLSGKSSVKLHWSNIRIKPDIIKSVFSVGISAFFRQFSSMVMIVFLNRILVKYGSNSSIAIIGAINRIIMMILMPIFGLAQGLQPVAGYNYGAKRLKLVKQSLKYASIWAVSITTAGFIIVNILPRQLISIFSTDADMIKEASSVLRTICMVMPLVGFQVIGAAFFQAIGKALPAFFLNISRQIVFFIPIVTLFSGVYGLQGVWYSAPVSDTLAFIVTLIFILVQFRKFNITITKKLAVNSKNSED